VITGRLAIAMRELRKRRTRRARRLPIVQSRHVVGVPAGSRLATIASLSRDPRDDATAQVPPVAWTGQLHRVLQPRQEQHPTVPTRRRGRRSQAVRLWVRRSPTDEPAVVATMSLTSRQPGRTRPAARTANGACAEGVSAPVLQGVCGFRLRCRWSAADDRAGVGLRCLERH
jgi:hypothetical protein